MSLRPSLTYFSLRRWARQSRWRQGSPWKAAQPFVLLVGAQLLSCADSPEDESGVNPSSTGGTGAASSGGSIVSSGGSVGASGGGLGTGARTSSGGAGGSDTGGTSAIGGSAAGGSGGSAAGGASGGNASGGNASGSSGNQGECNEASTEAAAPLSLSGATFAHDPTMIRVGETYYRFWTGDFIPTARSTDLRQWQEVSPVYDTYPSWVGPWLDGVPMQTFNFPWAPDVSYFDGKVHIYSSFSARFGSNVSCITHLSTGDIETEPFTDHGPVICSDGSQPYNAIDADIGFDDAGRPHFAWGSFWDGIFAAPLDEEGAPVLDESTHLARAPEIEAPVLFHRCGVYYLLVTWGLCCPGEGRTVNDLTYRVAVGRSDDILGPYVDRNGQAMTMGGGTLVVEGDGVEWAAAGHSDVMWDGDTLYHTYHAYRQGNGAASLRIIELRFDDDGWPIPHAP